MQIDLIEASDSQRYATSNKKSIHKENSTSINNKVSSPKNKPPVSPKRLAKHLSDEQKQQASPQAQHNPNEQQQPQFYSSKKKPKKSRKDLQRNVAYPEATIRQYLNQKRTTQNKICHVLFCLYMIVIVMLAGVGFFYGSYSYLGKFIPDNEQNVGKVQECPLYVSQSTGLCVTRCDSPNKLYLDRVCLEPPYQLTFSTALDKQITMYSLKQCMVQIVYGSFISLVISSMCFICLICFAKLIYFYIALTFVMLLGFAFFLLKSINDKLGELTSNTGITVDSIFYKQMANILPLAYILMALYLIVFPFVLFSPSKIKSAVRMISRLSKYFSKMSTVNLFTYLVIFLTWGLTMLEIFLVINMFTAGNPQVQKGSFMFVFTKVSLSHPAVLVIHFLGIYWFFGTVISWHKYFISNAMCLWYFEDGENLYPVRRGLKRSWYSLGTAAVDALLIPLEWVMQVVYAGAKFGEQQQLEMTHNNNNTTTTADEQTFQCFCFTSLRQCLTSIYCKLNLHSSSSAPLTNYPYQQACEISAVTFSYHNHKFFNIGNTLSVLLTTFTCLIWLIVCYAVMYSQVYSKTFPPKITSLGLPMICVFLSALVVGSLFSNMYTSAVDCLIFCFLLQKKNNVANTKNQVKDILEQLYNDDELGCEEVVEMYQYEED